MSTVDPLYSVCFDLLVGCHRQSYLKAMLSEKDWRIDQLRHLEKKTLNQKSA